MIKTETKIDAYTEALEYLLRLKTQAAELADDDRFEMAMEIHKMYEGAKAMLEIFETFKQ